MCKNSDRKKLGLLEGDPAGGTLVGDCTEVVALCWQVITGLKQRIFRLEQQCKEKDNTIKYGLRGAGGGRSPRLLGATLGQKTDLPSIYPFHSEFCLLATSLFQPKTMRNASFSLPCMPGWEQAFYH